MPPLHALVDYDTHFRALCQLEAEFSSEHFQQARIYHEFLFKPDFSSWSASEFRSFVHQHTECTGNTDTWRLADDSEFISRFYFPGNVLCEEFDRLAERGRRILCGFDSSRSSDDKPEGFEFESEKIDWLKLLHEHGRHCPTDRLQTKWRWWNSDGHPLASMSDVELHAFRSDYSETPTGSFPSHPIVSSLQQDVFRASAELIRLFLDSPLVTQADYWEPGFPTIYLPDLGGDAKDVCSFAPSCGSCHSVYPATDEAEDANLVENEFLLRWGQRECKFGNTTVFRFLKTLWHRIGKYVSHSDLTDEVWGLDDVEANTIHKTASKLRRALNQAGIREFRVVASDGHYRLDKCAIRSCQE